MRGQTGRLEGGQRLAAAGGVPDVAAALDGPVLLVVVGDLDAVQDPLGGGDLIRPHDHQHIFRGKNTVPSQHIQNGVLGEEGAGKVNEIGNHLIAGVRPKGGKLKTVAGLLLFRFAGGCLTDGIEAGTVGVVLGVGTVGDHENLHILKESAPRPEGIPLVAVDLVESLPNGYAPAFQFNVHQRQTINQNRHIIAIVMSGSLFLAYLILVDHLKAVVVNVFLINQGDIFGSTVIPSEYLHEILLNLPGLFHDMLIGVGNGIKKEPLPFSVGELVAIQGLQLAAQVGDEIRLLMNWKILIALLGEQLNKLPLQRRLALVAVRAVFHRLVGGDDGIFGCGGNDVVGVHGCTPSSRYL